MAPGDRVGRVFVAAVVGGTVSEVTGGRFANGAMTGAHSSALDDEQKAGNSKASKVAQAPRERVRPGTGAFWHASARRFR